MEVTEAVVLRPPKETTFCSRSSEAKIPEVPEVQEAARAKTATAKRGIFMNRIS
jgi:hypothetical protein